MGWFGFGLSVEVVCWGGIVWVRVECGGVVLGLGYVGVVLYGVLKP